MKKCGRCKIEKPVSEFLSKSGLARSYCFPCVREYAREHYDSNKEKARWAARSPEKKVKSRTNTLKRKFNLTSGEFDLILEGQGWKCANSGCSNVWGEGDRRFHVDHDRGCCPTDKTCGECVRGILCPGCNTALGHVNDDMEKLMGLIEYLGRVAP